MITISSDGERCPKEGKKGGATEIFTTFISRNCYETISIPKQTNTKTVVNSSNSMNAENILLCSQPLKLYNLKIRL